jgi:flagellar biogenesis protein FliO
MRVRTKHIFAILPALLAHAPAQAQQLAQGGGIEISVWRVVFTFLFCIALAAGAIFALRRKLPTSTLFKRVGADRLKLVEQISLGPQRGIYLIELDGKEFLVLFSQQGASLTPTGGPPIVTGDDA